MVNIYIVYELRANLNYSGLTLGNCLFGAVKLTKNDDINKYNYSGYGIEFDGPGNFLFPTNKFGQNIIIFDVDMSTC